MGRHPEHFVSIDRWLSIPRNLRAIGMIMQETHIDLRLIENYLPIEAISPEVQWEKFITTRSKSWPLAIILASLAPLIH